MIEIAKIFFFAPRKIHPAALYPPHTAIYPVIMLITKYIAVVIKSLPLSSR